jgi:hypothetical protein
MQEVVGRAAVAEGLAAELQDGLTHLPGGGGRGHGLAERDGDGERHALRHLEEEAAVLEAEDATPDAVEMDGDHGHVDAREDLLDAAAEGQGVAGAAQGAFGEDADDVAGLQLLARLDQSGLDQLGVLAEGDGVHAAEDPVEAGHVVVGAVHDEADEALQAGGDQQAVDEGDVVADQERRAAARQVLRADDADAVDRVGEEPEREADHEVGQQVQHVERHDEGDEADDQHHLVGRQLQHVAEEPERAGGQQHAEHVEEVGGADQPAALVGGRALLQVGVERHHEEAAGETEQDQRGEGEAEGGRRPGQQQRADADADRPRHQAELRPCRRRAAGGGAADADADGDGRLQQAGAGIVEAERLLAEEDDAQLQQGAQEPEVGDAEDGELQRAVAGEVLEAGVDFAPGE